MRLNQSSFLGFFKPFLFCLIVLLAFDSACDIDWDSLRNFPKYAFSRNLSRSPDKFLSTIRYCLKFGYPSSSWCHIWIWFYPSNVDKTLCSIRHLPDRCTEQWMPISHSSRAVSKKDVSCSGFRVDPILLTDRNL